MPNKLFDCLFFISGDEIFVWGIIFVLFSFWFDWLFNPNNKFGGKIDLFFSFWFWLNKFFWVSISEFVFDLFDCASNVIFELILFPNIFFVSLFSVFEKRTLDLFSLFIFDNILSVLFLFWIGEIKLPGLLIFIFEANIDCLFDSFSLLFSSDIFSFSFLLSSNKFVLSSFF